MTLRDCLSTYFASVHLIDPEGGLDEEIYSKRDDLEEARSKAGDWLYEYHKKRREEKQAKE